MLIIHMQGGLGNQLYQYALFEKLKSLGKDVRLDASDYYPGAKFPEKRPLVLDHFPEAMPLYSSVNERKCLRDDSLRMFDRIRRKLFGSRDKIYVEQGDFDIEVFKQENAFLEGFWCNEAYFADIMPRIMERLAFPELDWTLPGDGGMEFRREKNMTCLREMEDNISIGIHIRLGDYTDDEHRWRYENICTREYYANALKLVINHFEKNDLKRKIYIFTDETDAVKKQLASHNGILNFLWGEDVAVCDWNGDRYSIFDLMLMGRCKAMICANSTFSMWGARLSPLKEHLMIRPLRHDNSGEPDIEHLKETWKNWIMFDRNGSMI